MKAPHVSPASIPAARPSEYVPAIKVNTVGYPTGWRKIAVFNLPPANVVVRETGGAAVLSIPPACVQARGLDPASQDQVWQVDFSRLERPGRYVVTSDGA